MERKIGEIFEYNGEWYQCVIGYSCNDCAFNNDNCEERERITLKNKLTKEEITGLCTSKLRSDGKSVIFKKLEKVGEPFFVNIQGNNVLKQRYKLYEPKVTLEDYWYRIDGNFISIEVKQKEDMKENKLNLKPFNLEAAKAGKPVCTRDGRKARIICFDAKSKDEKNIIALVSSKDCPGFENLIAYPNNGNYYRGYENNGDLMMLPEKKEGWVNICRNLNTNKIELDTKDVYSTKEEALQNLSSMTYVTTVKIEWEE